MMVSDDGLRLAFEKRELAVLTGMMAKEERPNLAALWFHGGKAQAWATDGHRAVLVEREDKPPHGDPKARPVGIPAVTAHHVAKTAGARDLVVVDIGGREVTIELRERNDRTTEITTFGDIEGRTRAKHVVTCKRHEGGYSTIEFAFPSYRTRGGKGLAVPFNPALLAPVITLASLADEFVWLNIGDDDGPILFLATADDGAVWRLVVMPKRAGSLVPPERVPAAALEKEPASRAKRAAKPAADPAGELSPPPSGTKPPATAAGTKPPEVTPPPPAPRARGRGKLRAAS